jgi:glycosyltransferase involved in cell wall biosynthesis
MSRRQSAMKVAIDATSLLLPGAGVRNYLHYWLLALMQAARERGDLVVTYPARIPLEAILNHQQSSAGSLKTALLLRTVQLLNLVGSRENPLLNLLIPGADVFHCSQHTTSTPSRKKLTATVFDFSCWTTPQYHTAENVAATRRYGETILKSCDGLIAISRYTARDAVDVLGIPDEKVRVIYPGVAESFFRITPQQTAAIAAKYALNSPYLLFAGCIEPRKNVPALIHAYRGLPRSIQRDVHLVIAGPFGWASEDVRLLLDQSGDTVRYLGYVPEPDMPGLFAGATAFVYPSFYEGFGLPVAQAMASGIPVITSNRSCLPEIASDGGILVDPDSIDDLRAAIDRLLTSPDLRKTLAARGRARANDFHWRRAAAESLKLFREVAGFRGSD